MKNRFAFIYVIMATLFFSSMEVAIKSSKGAFNPIQLNFIRFLVGGLILMPIALNDLKKADYKLQKSDYFKFAISGFMNVVVSMSFYTSSVAYIPAYTAAIIFAGNTFFSIMLASIILKEKIDTRTFVALAISLFGIMYIINPFNFEGSLIGVVLCLTSAVFFAFYGVLGKFFARASNMSSIVITSFGFLFGVAELLILICLSHIPPISDMFLSIGLKHFSMIPVFAGINSSNIHILMYIAVGVTGMGFASYFLAMENLPVVFVSLVFFIKPVLAPIIAYIFIREVISMHNLIGLMFIVIGSCILFFTNLKKTKI